MKYIQLTLIALCFGAPLFGQNAPLRLSMSQAVEQALGQVYTIKIAEKQIQIAQNNNNLGEAGGLPQVTANIAANNSFSNINNPTSFLNGATTMGNSTTVGVDAAWTLFDGYKVRLNRRRLDLAEAQQKGNLKAVVEQQVQQVMRAYLAALVQQKRLDLNAELLALSRDKIKYVEARREYGQAVEFDLLQVRDAYLNDSIQWTLQKNNYEVALQQLALTMGLDAEAGQAIELADTLAFALPNYTYEELKNTLLASNQTLSNLKLAESMANIQVELQNSNKYPRLLMNVGINEQLNITKVEGLTQMPNTWRSGSTLTGYVNFSLSYNIYNGGKVHRSLANAQLQSDIAQLQRKEQERVFLQQLQQNIYRYDNQKALLNLAQQLAQNAARSLAMAEERFKSGTLNFFDLRTVQINYIRSINALQDAYLNAKNTEIELLLSAGQLIK